MTLSQVMRAKEKLEQGNNISLEQAKVIIHHRLAELTRELRQVQESCPEDFETIQGLYKEITGIKFVIDTISGSYMKLDI